MLSTVPAESGLTGSQRRQVAYAAARRYLSSSATEDIADLSADELRESLRKCRELLTSAVELSQEPIARTVDETAAALAISPMTVYRLINSGDLNAYRIWRRFIRIDDEALRAYLAVNTLRPGEITGKDVASQHVQPAWR
jgi:excisionase family DNA binding protein